MESLIISQLIKFLLEKSVPRRARGRGITPTHTLGSRSVWNSIAAETVNGQSVTDWMEIEFCTYVFDLVIARFSRTGAMIETGNRTAMAPVVSGNSITAKIPEVFGCCGFAKIRISHFLLPFDREISQRYESARRKLKTEMTAAIALDRINEADLEKSKMACLRRVIYPSPT